MKVNNGPLLVIAITFMLGSFSLLLFGQEDIIIGKKDTITLTSAVQAGDKFLEPGRYQVQHVDEGDEHFMVFKKVYSSARPKEVARAECRFQPLAIKVETTQVIRDQEAIKEIRIRGENVKHVLVQP